MADQDGHHSLSCDIITIKGDIFRHTVNSPSLLVIALISSWSSGGGGGGGGGYKIHQNKTYQNSPV